MNAEKTHDPFQDITRRLHDIKWRIDNFYRRDSHNRFFSFILSCFSAVLFLFILTQSSIFRFSKIRTQPQPHVAIVSLEGVISDNLAYYDVMANAIDAAFNTPLSTEVIIRFNSNGGTVAASFALYNKILEKKKETGKKVYAFIHGYCCSAAYLVALACDKIYANTNSIVGSIGVLRELVSFKNLSDKLGIELVGSYSGENKKFVSPFSSKEEIQEYFNKPWSIENTNIIFQAFKDIINLHRGELLNDEDDLVFTGACFVAKKAYQYGLIDGVGSLNSVILNTCSTKVIQFVKLNFNNTWYGNMLPMIQAGSNIQNFNPIKQLSTMEYESLLPLPLEIPITIDINK